jgi:hypothetical protein
MAVVRKAEFIILAAIIVLGSGFGSVAHGQSAIAFVPNIGFIPSGATMTVTPAVSADRRYVRLTVEPFFNSLNGFSTFNVQGAVSGAGGLGGFGGLNGVIAGGGFASAGLGMNPGGFFGRTGELLAGHVPTSDELSDLGPPLGDPLNPEAAALSNTGPDLDGRADENGGIPEAATQRAGEGRSVRAETRQLPQHRRTTARKSSRRRSATPVRRSR